MVSGFRNEVRDSTMTRLVQRFEAVSDNDRRVFILKYLGSRTTGYALYQYTGEGLERLEEIETTASARDERDREAVTNSIEVIYFYCGTDWEVNRV